MIRVTDQYFWNFVFLVFFLILVVMGAIILETESRIPLADLGLVDYVLVTLATWRVVSFVVSDNITRFFREQFWDVKKVGRGHQLDKPKTGPRRTLADLLSSPWSFGLWAAAMMIFFYLITPYSVFPMVLLALSGVATALKLAVDFIANKSE